MTEEFIPPRWNSSSPPPFDDSFHDLDSYDKDVVNHDLGLDNDVEAATFSGKNLPNGHIPQDTHLSHKIDPRKHLSNTSDDLHAVNEVEKSRPSEDLQKEDYSRNTDDLNRDSDVIDGSFHSSSSPDPPDAELHVVSIVEQIPESQDNEKYAIADNHGAEDNRSLDDGNVQESYGRIADDFAELTDGKLQQAMPFPSETDSDTVDHYETRANESSLSELAQMHGDVSSWADFAGVSGEFALPSESRCDDPSGFDTVTILAPENDDEFGEFSDFSSSSAAQATDTFQESDLLQHQTFAEAINIAFSAQLESPSSTAALPQLNLDQTLAVDSVPTLTARACKCWMLLKNLDETHALKYQWSTSAIRQSLLRSLNLSYLSAFSMQKHESVHVVPARKMGDILMPVKLDQHSRSTTISNGQALHIDESMHTDLTKHHSDNNFNNQLLDFLGPLASTENVLLDSKSGHSLSSPNISAKTPTLLIPSSIPHRSSSSIISQHSLSTQNHNNGLSMTVKHKEDVDDVIARFRNLNFMQSNVLLVPASGTNKSVAKF